MGGYQAPGSIHNQAAARFGGRLAERLGDRIRFELIPSVLDHGHPSGALVPMVERGELTCCYMSTVRFSQRVPECRIFELPFVVRDRRKAWAALDGEFGALLRRRIEAAFNCRALGFWDNGFRHLTNKVRPIRRPEDCRGLRIRTQMTPLHGETFRALGFEPIAADVKEFVEHIGGDRFQAQDNPLTNIIVFRVHEYHRYITLTGHLWGASVLACNREHYRSWPEDVRAAVDAAAAEATALQRELAEAEDTDALARFDPARNEVIRLTDAEHAAFVAAVQPVLDKHRGDVDAKLFAYLNAWREDS
jgi:TRAP-type C4-dicarboxylate transport system substrate-binding protein